MLIVHGIKNCDSVKKAIKFLKENKIEHTFRDFKSQSVTCQEINNWLHYQDIDTLFNAKSSTYRTLKLKNFQLTLEQKVQWLCNENLLIKRPVIQCNDEIIVGYDENIYKTKLL
jgi:arsenate reductase (glutaredoxin)